MHNTAGRLTSSALQQADHDHVIVLVLEDGESTCGEPDLDGGNLPDDPFFDLTQAYVSTPSIDIFSLGSIFYTILTGYWLYKSPGPFKTAEEKFHYQRKATSLFSQGQFPDVTALTSGKVVIGCWTKECSTVKEILRALEVEMPMDGDQWN